MWGPRAFDHETTETPQFTGDFRDRRLVAVAFIPMRPAFVLRPTTFALAFLLANACSTSSTDTGPGTGGTGGGAAGTGGASGTTGGAGMTGAGGTGGGAGAAAGGTGTGG
jgi:hypothetical protein